VGSGAARVPLPYAHSTMPPASALSRSRLTGREGSWDWSDEKVRAKPANRSVRETTIPTKGPTKAKLKRAWRFLGGVLMEVMKPHVPSVKEGRSQGG